MLLVSLALTACSSMAPEYHSPELPAQAAFKEALAADSAWKPAEPSDSLARGEWWRVFGDSALNGLQTQALAANQDLRAAAARLEQARAIQQNARADRMPRVDAGFGPTRQRPSPASRGLPDDASTQASTLWRASLGVSYEADLFGRIASQVDAATAELQQNEALLRSVLLALQADVAQAYFLLRELDSQRQLYLQAVRLREETLRLVQRRFDEGDISELDVARAQTELAEAKSEELGLERTRAAAEHALAILLGKTPAEFTLPAAGWTQATVNIPPGLPSALLERRPDIAAAERAMAAANSRIGAAQAAFFPRLELTGALGYESSQLGQLFDWSSRTFLLGPLVGSMLSLPIFDGGRREAGLALARARYEEDAAKYRQTVLTAFKEVEDNLANLRILGGQTRVQGDAVQASRRAAQLSHIQYREGSISYLDVIDADRSVLRQQRLATQMQGEQARFTVNLIRAMGGGW